MHRYICDGCNRILDRSEIAGQKEIRLGAGSMHGTRIIVLNYCSPCWEKISKQGVKAFVSVDGLCG